MRIWCAMLVVFALVPAFRGFAADPAAQGVDAVVSKSAGTLVLRRDGVPFREFKAGFGEEWSVPCGKYRADARLAYPAYETGGKKYSNMSAENPLGARWIELTGTDGTAATGIRGTNPRFAGAPDLFIRLDNRGITELYGLLPQGAAVEIIP